MALSYAAAEELLAHLRRHEDNWARWLSRRSVVVDLLDPHTPLLLGGREALAQAGLALVEAQPMLDPTEQLAINLYAWRAMTTTAVLDDAAVLVRPVHLEDRLQDLLLDTRRAPEQLAREKLRWTESIAAYQAAAAAEGFSVDGRQAPASLLESMVKNMGNFIDSRCLSTPPASLRLDAMMRVHTLLHLRAVQAEESYNAAKNANDAIDLDLHRYLALPAAVCTEDGGVHNDLESARAWQRRWVVRMADLASPARRAQLLRLDWPVS